MSCTCPEQCRKGINYTNGFQGSWYSYFPWDRDKKGALSETPSVLTQCFKLPQMPTWRYMAAVILVFPEGVQGFHLAFLLTCSPHLQGLNHQFPPVSPTWLLAAPCFHNHQRDGELTFQKTEWELCFALWICSFCVLLWACMDGLWLDLRFEIEFLWTPLGARKRMEWQRDCWSLTPACCWLLSSLLVVALNKTALSLHLLWTCLHSQSLRDALFNQGMCPSS